MVLNAGRDVFVSANSASELSDSRRPTQTIYEA